MPLICLFLIVAYFYVDRRGLPQLPSLPEISTHDLQWTAGIVVGCILLRWAWAFFGRPASRGHSTPEDRAMEQVWEAQQKAADAAARRNERDRLLSWNHD